VAIETGSMERGLGQEKSMCLKTNLWFTLALTDMKNEKVLQMLI